MDFFNYFMPFAIPTVAIGIITFIIIAIVQEARTGGRAEAIRSAFIYVTSIMTLFIVIGAVLFLLQQGARQLLPQAAPLRPNVSAPPPTLFLTAGTAGPSLYVCPGSCQFSAADRDQLAAWKEQYAEWRKGNPTRSTGRYSDEDKRQTINAISFLVVALPLYIWFFFRWAKREAAKRQPDSQGKGASLRNAYLYIVAFSGLLGLIISGAFVLNTALRSSFGLNKTNTTQPIPLVSKTSTEAYGVRSVINCTTACGFTAEDKALAQQWMVDYDQWQKTSMTAYPAQTNVQTELANTLPALLVSLVLFLYHLLTVRRESRQREPGVSTLV